MNLLIVGVSWFLLNGCCLLILMIKCVFERTPTHRLVILLIVGVSWLLGVDCVLVGYFWLLLDVVAVGWHWLVHWVV